MTLNENHLWLSGIELFNAGEFFECHEVLEDLWNEQVDPEKQLTQGVLQIAVGYLHLGRDNRVGALKLLTRGLARVQPFLPSYGGFMLDNLARAAQNSIQAIKANADTVPGAPRIEPSTLSG
ncbi:MAG: DUF309 domain-containing protein [Candidatus Obscuribacterales bacterium]|nr:DUF309 domain-containing protein [Candidatus Obscuribacterales bacterium]